MKILIFSESSWDDMNSLGNTLSNFFEGNIWSDDTFYNIYMRDSNPNNNVCKDYYRMTLINMIKHYFNKEKIGETLSINKKESKINNIKREQKYIDIIHKYSINFTYNIADNIYRKKKWQNSNFKNYINKVKPDIFFAFLTNVAMLNPVIKYIKENTDAKVVLFIADDTYGSIDKKSKTKQKKLRKEYKEIIDMADKLYGASEVLCEEYSKQFQKEITPLYKGCSFEYSVNNKINDPIKFVYAGNLFYGRDEILSKIGHAIDNNNRKSKRKAILEIYTGATITDELKQKLNIENSSVIMGKRDYNEIKKIMNDADFNLHVESFAKEEIKRVRYSFSTKIIDCLQSGSSLLAIGPSNVSSIKYIKKIPGAYVVDDINNLENEIITLINNNSNNILDSAKIIRNFAIDNHDIEKNQKKLKNELKKIIKK